MATKFADVKDVRTVAKTMPDEHVHCRTLGHVWATRDVKPLKSGFLETLQCKSCTFLKETTYDKRGYVVEQHVYYPEGYLLKGLGRLRSDTRAVLKVDSLKRYVKSKSDA